MGIDWSKAPEWAQAHGRCGHRNFWISEQQYAPVTRPDKTTICTGIFGSASFSNMVKRPQEWPETEERINNIGRNRTLDDMGHYNRNADEAFGDELSVYATAKHDSDKPRYDLLPPVAIDLMAQVMTFGAKKYKPEGWRTVPDALQRYQAAMLRHAFAIQRGELIDAESGLPHAAHVMCCAAFIAELQGEK